MQDYLTLNDIDSTWDNNFESREDSESFDGNYTEDFDILGFETNEEDFSTEEGEEDFNFEDSESSENSDSDDPEDFDVLEFETGEDFSTEEGEEEFDSESGESDWSANGGRGADVDAGSENDGGVIDVDSDFNGNLEEAIAAADNGDVVRLGNGTYNTAGITIDKDITIDGQQGSVVDGGGTGSAIFNLTPDAAGATIQDVEITNANNGIYSYGASNLTLQNLNVNNIGVNQTNRHGENNTGIILNYADGLQLLDSTIQDIGKKGVGIGDTNGATIRGLDVQNINLAAEHSQSHDAAGVKLYNTNNVNIEDSYFSNINANSIWNDTSNNTLMAGNAIELQEDSFVEPYFDNNVAISGIYNEKSSNSVVRNNRVSSSSEFIAFNATEFTAETLVVEGNNFPTREIGTTDYWANEQAEKLIAQTEDPSQADFSMFHAEYYGQAIIG